MIVPGLVSVTFRRLKPHEIVSLARDAHLSAIEWGGDVHIPHGDIACAREVQRLTLEEGLEVSAYGSYYRVGTRDQESGEFERIVDTAQALGAPTIRVWAGEHGSRETDEGERLRVVDDMLRIAELAAGGSISISCEFHSGTLTDAAASAADLLQAVGHPNVSTFWQPPNGAAFEACLSGLQTVLPRLGNFHVFHWWPTEKNRRPLSEGTDRWLRYLQTIESVGGRRFGSLEFVAGDSIESFRNDAATLLRWLAGL